VIKNQCNTFTSYILLIVDMLRHHTAIFRCYSILSRSWCSVMPMFAYVMLPAMCFSRCCAYYQCPFVRIIVLSLRPPCCLFSYYIYYIWYILYIIADKSSLESQGTWRWRTTLRMTAFLHFLHRPEFEICTGNYNLWEAGSISVLRWGKETHTLLGPLERASLNHLSHLSKEGDPVS
jgi:hypothetical protein